MGNFIRTQRNECRSGYNRIPQKLLQDRPHIMAQNFADVSDYIGGADIKDPGYAAVVKAFQTFSTNYQAYLVFIALLFMIPMAIWIYRNSSMPCLSFIIFSTLFYSFYAVTGIRQTIATSLVVFIGYEFIKKKKPIPFLLLMFIAFFIHKSCICFLPFVFFAHKKSPGDMSVFFRNNRRFPNFG